MHENKYVTWRHLKPGMKIEGYKQGNRFTYSASTVVAANAAFVDLMVFDKESKRLNSEDVMFEVEMAEEEFQAKYRKGAARVIQGLACWRIFDQTCWPCQYSGAIQLGCAMNTYRDNCGCVGRSWEIELVKVLNSAGVGEVLKIKQKRGVKAAVLHLFTDDGWSNTFTRAFVRIRKRVRYLQPEPARPLKAVSC